MALFPFNLKCSAVFLMIASFLAAAAFAIGHDMFYQSLNGKPVLNAQPLASLKSSLHVSDQQLYISLGTFFAFMAKSSLGVSVSTTFDQFAWKSIQGERTRIDIIDNLFSVLKNGFTVANLRLWRHSPISMTLAVICWLLPVASIISPATLSVQLAPFNVYVLKRIPRVDFTSANFASFFSALAINPRGPDFWATLYKSPTAETQRVVNSVATQGTILQIDPPAVNSSWSMGFYGPAIVCDKVNQSLATHITQNVAQAIHRSEVVKPDLPSFTRFVYLSWAPETDNPVESVPFYQNNRSDMFTQRWNQLGPQPKDPEDGLTLNMDQAVQNSTILHCMLHNASYQANLTFVNGEQTIHVTDRTVLNPIVFIFGVDNHDNGKPTANDSFVRNAQVMESLSYQSIMDAFGGLLVGSITSDISFIEKPDVNLTLSYTERPNTNIISTILMETEEMRFIDSLTSPDSDNPFPKYWRGQSVSLSNHSSPPLSKALEDLFRNITFSLMSSNMFQPNYTVRAVPETNVTITSYHSIYIYTRSILWAAYGTALGATALSVIAGVLVYFSNDGSHSTKFSTVFRVTQGAKVSTNLSMKDYSGLDPLPDHIAKAKMTIGYSPDYPVRVSSTAPLDQPHQEPTASSQLLHLTPGDLTKSSVP
ncbi:hypothetical protein BDV41DRAFT_585210 [Aspergillus transmontanensis]|uniref:Transmembrane protein n=1 Tax=Aspergillus transmontanensis TaxID=1034304 RepID=A0A5N6W724_9EURO|nr:hypothetical protein BDV41DRAFT_585210 [Aspergillus transmontanensis]